MKPLLLFMGALVLTLGLILGVIVAIFSSGWGFLRGALLSVLLIYSGLVLLGKAYKS